MKEGKIIGGLLIIGALGVLVPYTVLTIVFDYPDILRKDPGTILTKFHEGGNGLIFTWMAFAILGLPLVVAYGLIGQLMGKRSVHIKWVTSIGIISGIAQIIGLLRWVFVIPVLASQYVQAESSTSKETITIVFSTVHQFAGVLLGEFIGQLFTIIWTIMISVILYKAKLIPKWVSLAGIVSSVIYFIGQAELIATVIPGFPAWEAAGFIGSTLWLLWLVITGVFFMIRKVTD